MTNSLAVLAAIALAGSAALAAQPKAPAATAKPAKVQAGSYKVDPDHTQVIWSVDHFGFSRLYGMVGSMSGTLDIDPARPAAAKVAIDIPCSTWRNSRPPASSRAACPCAAIRRPSSAT